MNVKVLSVRLVRRPPDGISHRLREDERVHLVRTLSLLAVRGREVGLFGLAVPEFRRNLLLPAASIDHSFRLRDFLFAA